VGELSVGQGGRLTVRGGAPRWRDARGRVGRVDPSPGVASTAGCSTVDRAGGVGSIGLLAAGNSARGRKHRSTTWLRR
jgi:hypothetical protein